MVSKLIGCVECNCWRGGKSAFIVDLSVEEIRLCEMADKLVQFDDEMCEAKAPHYKRPELLIRAIWQKIVSHLHQFLR
jgi:hypothetical protein